ncbi:16S rRNA (adenine(1518)-N(6)/adenine(1519)-N(6))-dimethyltransferase RsmA [Chloroflexota bacterium]
MAKEAVQKRRTPSSEPLLAQTKGLLRRFHLQARKSLGQHFLIDGDVLGQITAAAEITASDIVMEIGPGLGVLTRELARQAGLVIAVELDNQLAAILDQTMAACGNVAVINKDILEIEPAVLLEGQKGLVAPAAQPLSYKVVANLPYYITAAVLRHFLEASIKPQIMVVMVQKEVAEAIVAKPGDMSLLSISVQFYGKPEIISYVPAQCFYPPPEVDSAVLRIDLYTESAVAVTDVNSYFRLVQDGFSSPRKQLANSLSRRLALPKSDVVSLLERAGIVPQRRAETLSLDEWARLWQVFIPAGKKTC